MTSEPSPHPWQITIIRRPSRARQAFEALVDDIGRRVAWQDFLLLFLLVLVILGTARFGEALALMREDYGRPFSTFRELGWWLCQRPVCQLSLSLLPLALAFKVWPERQQAETRGKALVMAGFATFVVFTFWVGQVFLAPVGYYANCIHAANSAQNHSPSRSSPDHDGGQPR